MVYCVRPFFNYELENALQTPSLTGELRETVGSALEETERLSRIVEQLLEMSRMEAGGLRLSFAGVSPERIREGVSILGGVFGNELERVRAMRRMAPAPALV